MASFFAQGNSGIVPMQITLPNISAIERSQTGDFLAATQIPGAMAAENARRIALDEQRLTSERARFEENATEAARIKRRNEEEQRKAVEENITRRAREFADTLPPEGRSVREVAVVNAPESPGKNYMEEAPQDSASRSTAVVRVIDDRKPETASDILSNAKPVRLFRSHDIGEDTGNFPTVLPLIGERTPESTSKDVGLTFKAAMQPLKERASIMRLAPAGAHALADEPGVLRVATRPESEPEQRLSLIPQDYARNKDVSGIRLAPSNSESGVTRYETQAAETEPHIQATESSVIPEATRSPAAQQHGNVTRLAPAHYELNQPAEYASSIWDKERQPSSLAVQQAMRQHASAAAAAEADVYSKLSNARYANAAAAINEVTAKQNGLTYDTYMNAMKSAAAQELVDRGIGDPAKISAFMSANMPIYSHFLSQVNSDPEFQGVPEKEKVGESLNRMGELERFKFLSSAGFGGSGKGARGGYSPLTAEQQKQVSIRPSGTVAEFLTQALSDTGSESVTKRAMSRLDPNLPSAHSGAIASFGGDISKSPFLRPESTTITGGIKNLFSNKDVLTKYRAELESQAQARVPAVTAGKAMTLLEQINPYLAEPSSAGTGLRRLQAAYNTRISIPIEKDSFGVGFYSKLPAELALQGAIKAVSDPSFEEEVDARTEKGMSHEDAYKSTLGKYLSKEVQSWKDSKLLRPNAKNNGDLIIGSNGKVNFSPEFNKDMNKLINALYSITPEGEQAAVRDQAKREATISRGQRAATMQVYANPNF